MTECYHGSFRFPIAAYLGMMEGSTTIALSWFCMARHPGRQSRRITGRGAAHGLDWLAVAGSTLQRLLFFLATGVHTGFVEGLGWFLMAPKMLKTTRVVQRKPNPEINVGRRDKKHSVGPPKDRASAQRKAQQSSPVMEKLQDNAKHVPTVATGPQIPAMFKKPLRTNQMPPKNPVMMGCKEPGLQYTMAIRTIAQGLWLGQCTARMEQV
ncbi:hypothetical protein NDU88_005332 [Pleurodeles waltl]|uniref:Uncharacterized protein n=1 Tax=Pleurodeles waltl TaxID=8319 RepID=A0AAV7LKT6_PLEWA|nr:hypothetical protein NDU88_005332 [Pleurodeles waltl]